jgi:acetyl-CoA/propionyl-CoA carboxylase biotin carboxyl carrier protein
VSQEDVVLRGHAIECRVNAEDAARAFAPAPGQVGAYKEPSGPGVRVDSGLEAGGEVSPNYDPMVAKLVVWDTDREQATRRMLRALAEYRIEGLTTLIPFHRALLATEQWSRAETCRDLLGDEAWLQATAPAPQAAPQAPADAPEGEGETVEQAYTVEVSGRRFDVKVIGPPVAHGVATNGAAAAPTARRTPRRERGGAGASGAGGDSLVSPLQGTVLRLAVEQGAQVEAGALVAVVEAMKMENEITAHKAGTVAELPVAEGGSVSVGDTLAVITDG